jgi:hypothetical protein
MISTWVETPNRSCPDVEDGAMPTERWPGRSVERSARSPVRVIPTEFSATKFKRELAQHRINGLLAASRWPGVTTQGGWSSS